MPIRACNSRTGEEGEWIWNWWHSERPVFGRARPRRQKFFRLQARRPAADQLGARALRHCRRHFSLADRRSRPSPLEGGIRTMSRMVKRIGRAVGLAWTLCLRGRHHGVFRGDLPADGGRPDRAPRRRLMGKKIISRTVMARNAAKLLVIEAPSKSAAENLENAAPNILRALLRK